MDNTFIIYLTFGTIPSLFSEINIFLDQRPSYVFVRSSGNFDTDCIKQLPHVLGFHQLTLYEDSVFFKEEYKLVVDAINEAKQKNPKAKFLLYIDDIRVQFYLKPFGQANALKDISKIVLLSEGNASKFLFYNLKENDEIECEKKWKKLSENFDNDEDLIKIDNYPYWLSTQKNVEYLVPYHKLFNNEKVHDDYKKKMHLSDFDIEAMFNKLNDDQKKYIFDFSSLKIKKNQKYLILIGTLDFGDKEITTAIIQNLIDQMLDDYKEYTILYKSHPLSHVEDNHSLKKYLEEKEIKILPNKIPIEVILWEYQNIDIGGFSSSIVSLIDPKRVKFVFGQNLGYSDLIFNKDNPLPSYNVLISQNIANHLLIYRYDVENKINERFSNIENNYLTKDNDELRKEIDELNTKLQVLNNETRITRFFYNILRKIKHFFFRKS